MFDAVTLAAVTDELNEKILNGRVQAIVQLDALSFGFEIYARQVSRARLSSPLDAANAKQLGVRARRHYLFATAQPDAARVHLAAQKLRASGLPPSPLLLLLRKYTDGGLIQHIEQIPHERVLKIFFAHPAEGATTLVIETIGRYSNLILLDANDSILDAAKRIDATMNRARVTLPKHAYTPPPPQAKLDPATLTPSDVARILTAERNSAAPLAQTLVRTIAGVSPLLAREIEFRAGARADTEKILATLQQLSHAPWQPSVAYENDAPSAFAPYPLTYAHTHTRVDSISAAIETFYGAAESYATVKDAIAAKLREMRERLARKRDSLALALPRDKEIERLRESGELILAYAHQIAKGQSVLIAETEVGELEIPLNPHLSVVENAQKYFKEYHRQKDAGARVPALLAAASADLEYAEQMLNDLDLAENRAEIDAAVDAARTAGLIAEKRARGKVEKSEPRAVQSRDGFTILVGKNARQNDEITFTRAAPDALWLHARSVAGAHVVIIRAGKAIPASTIEEAAQLAAQNSQARSESHADVIVTERRNVRRVRGGKAGMVTVRNERVVRVELQSGK